MKIVKQMCMLPSLFQSRVTKVDFDAFAWAFAGRELVGLFEIRKGLRRDGR
jgi:hypothetical protein